MSNDKAQIRQSLLSQWETASFLKHVKSPDTFSRDFPLAVNAGHVRELIVDAATAGLISSLELSESRVLWDARTEPKADRVYHALAFAHRRL